MARPIGRNRSPVKPANTQLAGLGTTIFTVMSALAVEHDAINLGQGFPDTDGPRRRVRPPPPTR